MSSLIDENPVGLTGDVGILDGRLLAVGEPISLISFDIPLGVLRGFLAARRPRCGLSEGICSRARLLHAFSRVFSASSSWEHVKSGAEWLGESTSGRSGAEALEC